ncbi:DUF3556 domain-containing protein [Nocardia sp. NPDC003726]
MRTNAESSTWLCTRSCRLRNPSVARARSWRSPVDGGHVGLLDPKVVVALVVALCALGLRDKTVFLAARPEHYLVMLLMFFVPFADMMIGFKLVMLALWWPKSAELKPEQRVTMSAGLPVSQSTKLYGPEIADILIQSGLGWRTMHTHGRGLNGLISHAIDNEDDYAIRDGEVETLHRFAARFDAAFTSRVAGLSRSSRRYATVQGLRSSPRPSIVERSMLPGARNRAGVRE